MHQASMDAFEAATKPDRFHQSLSSAWGSFLSAQHCNREVNALRKALDDHVQQSRLSITSLQEEGKTRHDLLSAAVAESQSKIEQYDTRLKEMATLSTNLSTLQHEFRQNRADTLNTVTELSKNIAGQQECLEKVRSNTSEDIRKIQEQCRFALEKFEFLQGELRETRAEKTAVEQKLAALESRIAAITEIRQDIPVDTIRFLEEMLSRRDEFMGLLDAQRAEAYSSDTTFIWDFINSIEDPAMSKHIQESLALRLPECVTVSRDTRRKNPQRHINISKGLTWRKFREALVRIPGPS
ncbi:hypothetical protein NEMBOFW57_002421 [Staphylotrichum longicolle]|uniref:Uncharacterized protein n=1 Tax=Staphylotrichum longicolle TaxID=669026 RepID=A0AAD4F3G5_9PEZI|nr:hypothetical protein NEMBOFW57_002421 [Staphylotrichum longicolle]